MVTKSTLKSLKDNLGDDSINFSRIEEDCQDEKVRRTLSIPSLVSATKSALKGFKDESNKESSNSIEGTEEAYRGKKFPRARSTLSIPCNGY